MLMKLWGMGYRVGVSRVYIGLFKTVCFNIYIYIYIYKYMYVCMYTHTTKINFMLIGIQELYKKIKNK